MSLTTHQVYLILLFDVIVIFDFGTYDFVVIGAGSAGAVVASRLSEIYSWRILLLETGKAGNNFTDIPAMYGNLYNTEYNWGFVTTPQTSCCLAMNGSCSYPRGKALGGTSTINGMIYTRGNKLDYDNWARAGNEGWYYKDVLPYFKKSENSVIFGNNFYHSTGGYLNVEQYKPVSRTIPTFLKANVEMGTPEGDYNGVNQLVTESFQFTTIYGRRMSTEKAFLYPAKNRKNLITLIESYVTRINIDQLSKSATGVIFSHNKLEYNVNVTKEVILSAGVFGSPFILMHSGVGPNKELKKYGIPIVENLNVGNSLKDHMYVQFTFNSSMPELQTDIPNTIHQYLFGFGPLTSSSDVVSFYNLYLNNYTVPNLEVTLRPQKPLGITNKKVIEMNRHRQFSIISILLHTKSVGRLYLKSKDPYEFPAIDINCLSDPKQEDVAELLKAIHLVFKLLNQNAFKAFNPQLVPDEACIQYQIMSENYWRCVLKQTASPALHGVGTCRMGPSSTNGAVVDNKLRVYGIKRLRIADTSIIPVLISGHTNAAAIMVGERAADFIKQEYGLY